RALPRERGPGPAVAPPPAGHPNAAVAAAPAGGRPAGGGVEARLVPDPLGDVPRVSAGRLRRAGVDRADVARPLAPAAGGVRGHGSALAVRHVAGLRL